MASKTSTLVPPSEVLQFLDTLNAVLSSRLFHDLKKANPKVSDQRLTEVVFRAWKHAKDKKINVPRGDTRHG